MSLDEMRRVRVSGEKWYQFRYPLIFEVPMRRSECLDLVKKMGWPEPPRSACWMCPNRENSEWQDMKKNWPEDFARACNLEAEIQLQRADFFFHRSLKPLATVEFTDTQFSMLTGDDEFACTEGCFT